MAEIPQPHIHLEPDERLLAQAFPASAFQPPRVWLTDEDEYLICITTPDAAYAERLAQAINAVAQDQEPTA